MAEKLIVFIKKGEAKNYKKIFCIADEEFNSLKDLARCISENFADNWLENEIEKSESVSFEDWENLENQINDFLEDSKEDCFSENTAYA